MQDILLQLQPIFAFLHIPFDWVTNALLFIGTARLFLKPLFKAIETYVKETPTQWDDNLWTKIQTNSIYKGIVFVLDWVASVKLPTKESK